MWREGSKLVDSHTKSTENTNRPNTANVAQLILNRQRAPKLNFDGTPCSEPFTVKNRYKNVHAYAEMSTGAINIRPEIKSNRGSSRDKLSLGDVQASTEPLSPVFSNRRPRGFFKKAQARKVDNGLIRVKQVLFPTQLRLELSACTFGR